MRRHTSTSDQINTQNKEDAYHPFVCSPWTYLELCSFLIFLDALLLVFWADWIATGTLLVWGGVPECFSTCQMDECCCLRQRRCCNWLRGRRRNEGNGPSCPASMRFRTPSKHMGQLSRIVVQFVSTCAGSHSSLFQRIHNRGLAWVAPKACLSETASDFAFSHAISRSRFHRHVRGVATHRRRLPRSSPRASIFAHSRRNSSFGS